MDEFLDIISILINDLSKFYNTDTDIDKLKRRYALVKSEFPIKIYNDIGKYLIMYIDDIIELENTHDFTKFLNMDYDVNRPDAEQIIKKVKEMAIQLNKDKQIYYINKISRLIELYLAAD
jgi:hypothetical protein